MSSLLVRYALHAKTIIALRIHPVFLKKLLVGHFGLLKSLWSCPHKTMQWLVFNYKNVCVFHSAIAFNLLTVNCDACQLCAPFTLTIGPDHYLTALWPLLDRLIATRDISLLFMLVFFNGTKTFICSNDHFFVFTSCLLAWILLGCCSLEPGFPLIKEL